MSPTNQTTEQVDIESQNGRTEDLSVQVPVESKSESIVDSLGFDPIYLLALIPILLLAMLFAWFVGRRKKNRITPDNESWRGRFKKSDRFQESKTDSLPNPHGGIAQAPSHPETGAAIEPEFDFSADENGTVRADATIATELDFDNPMAETTAAFQRAKADSVSSARLDSELELLFAENKESDFDRASVEDSSVLPNAASSESVAAGNEVNAQVPPVTSNTKVPKEFSGWRKKKFPARAASASTKSAASTTTAGPTNFVLPADQEIRNEDRSADELFPKEESKTVYAEFTVAEPDSFEFDDDRLQNRSATDPNPTPRQNDDPARPDEPDEQTMVFDDDHDLFIEAEHSDFNAASADTAVDPGSFPTATPDRGKRTLAAKSELTVDQYNAESTAIPSQDSFQPPSAEEFQTVREPGFETDLEMDPPAVAEHSVREVELIETVEKLTTEKKALATRIATLETSLFDSIEQTKLASALQKQQLELQQQLSSLLRKLNAAEEENQNLRRKLEESESSIGETTELRAENESLQAQHLETISQLADLQNRLDLTEQENELLKQRADDFLPAQRDLESSNSQIVQLQSRLAEMTNEQDELRNQIREYETTVDQLQSENGELELLSSQLKLEADQGQNLQTQIETIEAEKEDLKKQGIAKLVAIEHQLKTANEKIDDFAAKLKDAEVDKTDLKNQLDLAKNAIKDRDCENTQLQKLQSELAAAKEKQQELREQVKSVESDSKQEVEKVSELARQLKDANLRNAELNDEVLRLGEATKRSAAIEEEVADLRDKLNLANEENSLLQDHLNESLSKFEQLEVRSLQYAGMPEKIEALDQEKLDLSQQLEELLPQLESKEQEIEALREKVAESQFEVTATNEDPAPRKSQNELIAEKTKRKFTRLYRAYERERSIRKGLETNLVQAEEQRDQIACEMKMLKQKADEPHV